MVEAMEVVHVWTRLGGNHSAGYGVPGPVVGVAGHWNGHHSQLRSQVIIEVETFGAFILDNDGRAEGQREGSENLEPKIGVMSEAERCQM